MQGPESVGGSAGFVAVDAPSWLISSRVVRILATIAGFPIRVGPNEAAGAR